VILENCYLTDEQKREGCRLAGHHGGVPEEELLRLGGAKNAAVECRPPQRPPEKAPCNSAARAQPH